MILAGRLLFLDTGPLRISVNVYIYICICTYTRIYIYTYDDDNNNSNTNNNNNNNNNNSNNNSNNNDNSIYARVCIGAMLRIDRRTFESCGQQPSVVVLKIFHRSHALWVCQKTWQWLT